MLTKVAVRNWGILVIILAINTSSIWMSGYLSIFFNLFSGNSTIFSNALYSSTSVSLWGFFITPRGFSAHYLSSKDFDPIFSIL
jgi:hypothetical protein